jgi:O-antigen ligase
MKDLNTAQRRALWPWLCAAILSFVWLQPHHHPPWSGFHEDAGMAVWMALGAFLLLFSVLRRGVQWDWLSVGIVALVPVVAIQSCLELIVSPAQAILFIMHLLGIAWCYAIGRTWQQSNANLLLDIVFMGIALAALGNVAVALHQWLRIMPQDIVSTSGAWLLNIGDYSRYTGNVGQPNEFATLIAWAMLAGVWAHLRNQIRLPVLTVYLAYLALGAALTQSRVGILELACVVVGMVVFRRLLGGLQLAGLMAATLMLQIALVAFLPDIMAFLLLDGEARALSEMGQDTVRLNLYAMVIDAIQLSPWWGYGASHHAQAQWAVVGISPDLHGFYMQAHNWLLDLMLWFGVPLALLLAGGLAWWGIGVLRNIRQVQGAIALLALGCFFIHATVELIHWVANFSLVAALFGGVLSAHTLKKTLLTTGRAFNLLMVALLGGLVIATIVDYIRLERNFIQLRAEHLRLRTDISEPPHAFVLYHLADSMRVGRMPLGRPVDRETLNWMEKTEMASPNTRTAFDLVVHFGLSGEHDKARLWMHRLNATSPKWWLPDYPRLWAIRKKEFPGLPQDLDWPTPAP